MLDALITTDHTLFRLINGAELGVIGVSFFQLITWLGSGAIVIPGFVAFWLYARERAPHLRRAARLLVYTFALSGVLSLALKSAVDRPRPPAIEQRLAVEPDQPGVILRTERMERRSFPSGHTQTAFSWAAGVAFSARRRRFGVLALCLAALVGCSRVVLGVHFPLDVLTGALLALAAAWGLSRRLEPRRRDL